MFEGSKVRPDGILRTARDWLRARSTVVLACIAVLIGGGTLAIVVDPDGDGPAPAHTITFTVNTQAGDGAPATTLEVPAPLAREAARVTEDGLKDETPPGTSAADLREAALQQEDIAATLPPLPTAGASAGFQGCVTRFVRNQSSRNGVRPIVQVLHYTVSSNRPGWDDVNAIVNFFNSSSSQASSNFVIDADGNCAYIVPIEAKAWTQAGGNPISVSYEIIAMGSESAYLQPAGYAKLKSVMQQVSQRTGIPMRRGRISGCVSALSGIVQHADGGTCWGGHGDIAPFSVDQVVSFVTKPDAPASPLTTVELKIVRSTATPKGTGHSQTYWCRRNVAQRATLLKLAHTTNIRWGLRRGDRYQLLGASWREHCR